MRKPNGSVIITGSQVPGNLPDRLIVEAINAFNQLRAFPLSQKEIFQWAQTIEAVEPPIDPLALCWLVDEMLVGRVQYDRGAGIQNLIQGVANVERVGNTFQMRENFPG